VLDATHKKVLDGAHSWSGYWVGKTDRDSHDRRPAARRHGHDRCPGLDAERRRLELAQDCLPRKAEELDIRGPDPASGPQAFGWFKPAIKNLA